MSVEIRLYGNAGSTLAIPAQDLLRAVGNTEPARGDSNRTPKAARGDAVALATLVFAIPCGILAAMEIMERARVMDLLSKSLEP